MDVINVMGISLLDHSAEIMALDTHVISASVATTVRAVETI